MIQLRIKIDSSHVRNTQPRIDGFNRADFALDPIEARRDLVFKTPGRHQLHANANS